jgi:hypothetical protein
MRSDRKHGCPALKVRLWNSILRNCLSASGMLRLQSMHDCSFCGTIATITKKRIDNRRTTYPTSLASNEKAYTLLRTVSRIPETGVKDAEFNLYGQRSRPPGYQTLTFVRQTRRQRESEGYLALRRHTTGGPK